MNLHQVDLLEHDHVVIYPLGDTHIGDKGFDEAHFRKYINLIKDTPNAYTVLTGDLMNVATKESVSDVYEELSNPEQQLDYTEALLKPIRHKIIGAIDGNHERRITKSTSINITRTLCKYLGIADMTDPKEDAGCKELGRFCPDSMLLKIRVGRQKYNHKPAVYVMYLTHGTGAGRKPGGKINKLQDLNAIVLADIYLAGHGHQQAVIPDCIFIPDLRNNTVPKMTRKYIMAGSFLKWDGYVRRYGFPPAALGTPEISLSGTHKEIQTTITTGKPE